MGAESGEAAHTGSSGEANASGNEAGVAPNAERLAQLERVLRDALLRTDENDLAADEREALRKIAIRCQGEPFSFDPVMTEIVAALIGAAFRVRVEGSRTCLDMSRTIAKTLWDDITVRERVEALWRQTCAEKA